MAPAGRDGWKPLVQREVLEPLGLTYPQYLAMLLLWEQARADLPPLAVQRARDYWGGVFPAGRVVIVGDTPADVYCARPIRARSVAVLTGFATREALVAAMPDVLLDDLTDRAVVEEALFGANEHG
jgi:phosphoglycolate phosphatase-like HAD superfamily hydrolase